MSANYKELSIKTFNNFKKKKKYKKSLKWYEKIFKFLDKFEDEKYVLLIFFNLIRDSTLGKYIISSKLRITLLVMLFYVITPFDAIVDTIPFIGYLDDAFMINLVYKTLKDEVDNYAIWYYNKYKNRTNWIF